jgi:hypothetical protein
MVIAEALSYSLPVITMKGAPWQELENRDCGWWIELSETDLAAAWQTAIDLPENRRKQMGRHRRLWMEESYAWPRIAEMKGVYEWVARRWTAPSCIITA